MSLEVIGSGLPRTGTESLKRALETLGYTKCYHMVELIQAPGHLAAWENADFTQHEWDDLFATYSAAVDFPAMVHWRTLAERYPEAKVIHSTRGAEDWYESICNTVFAAVSQMEGSDPATRGRRQLVQRDLVEGFFDNRIHDRRYMLERFAQHERDVRAAIAPNRLLVFEAKAGWPPLCEFLARPVPDSAYPRGNSTEDFRRNYLRSD